MSARRSIVAAAAAMTLTAFPEAQAPESNEPWVPRRTADGQPDLQGAWVNFDSTPFEPAEAALSLFDNPVNPPAHAYRRHRPTRASRPRLVPAAVAARATNGFDEQALNVMFKHNPARLLGLPRL